MKFPKLLTWEFFLILFKTVISFVEKKEYYLKRFKSIFF
jgi:hypothetical protein